MCRTESDAVETTPEEWKEYLDKLLKHDERGRPKFNAFRKFLLFFLFDSDWTLLGHFFRNLILYFFFLVTAFRLSFFFWIKSTKMRVYDGLFFLSPPIYSRHLKNFAAEIKYLKDFFFFRCFSSYLHKCMQILCNMELKKLFIADFF